MKKPLVRILTDRKRGDLADGLIAQTLGDYKSTLPDFLLEICDHVIKNDKAAVLRFQNLHRNVQQLISLYPIEPRPLVWLFFDPNFQQHIVADISNMPQPVEVPVEGEVSPLTLQQYCSMELSANPELVGRMGAQTIAKYRRAKLNSIDQLRMRAQSNRYYTPGEFLQDFCKLMNWNVIYRSSSRRSLQYLSSLFSSFCEVLTRKSFAKRFQQKRRYDLLKMFKYQTELKIQTKEWPSIPTEFREYIHINEYIPTPESRHKIIEEKLVSKKVPVECPEDCACLKDRSLPFCQFSLIEGTWTTQCKNRANRIQCSHSNPTHQALCRNSQIKGRKYKTCKVDKNSTGQYDIEECISWGIDVFTRKNIYYLLPQKQIANNQLTDNTDIKNQFIDECLLTAINFLDTDGYDMAKACRFILDKTPKKLREVTDDLKWKYCQTVYQPGGIFQGKFRLYAKSLLKAINTSPDPTSFRVHSKGKGARCINRQGIQASQFIVQYFGELYEPWRWYERQDFTKRFMKELKLSESVPDFYNICLEKHQDEADGYQMLVVDPIHRGNFSSRFSHSCNPNCGTIITVSDGKYYIGMYALRNIDYGEELTFDYCSTTESRYEHKHAICLCGMKACRGNYLQLSISKPLNIILDKHYCFQQRTVVLLKSLDPIDQDDFKTLAKHNIKDNILKDCPNWLIKWASLVTKFMEFECEQSQKLILKEMVDSRPQSDSTTQSKEPTAKQKLYAEIGKNQLFAGRFQNLVTTIDKLKYYLTSINDLSPPLTLLDPQTNYRHLASMAPSKQPSLLKQLKDQLQKYKCIREVQMLEDFAHVIENEKLVEDKLMLSRLCFLVMSQQIKISKQSPHIQAGVLSDIVYMYAFTHHYFTPHEYNAFSSEEIVISPKEFLNFSSKKDQIRKKDFQDSRKYSSQFVWGQLVAWYKQTIAQPQASLSQDRRGTLSYPTLETIIRSVNYPFEDNSRQNFLKTLTEKPHASWPPEKCPWSYKNNKKSYGTMLFESYYCAEQLRELQVEGMTLSEEPGKRLLSAVIGLIDSSFKQKLNLFIKVQSLITGKPQSYITQLASKLSFEQDEYEESKRSYEHKINPQKTQKRALKKRKPS